MFWVRNFVCYSGFPCSVTLSLLNEQTRLERWEGREAKCIASCQLAFRLVTCTFNWLDARLSKKHTTIFSMFNIPDLWSERSWGPPYPLWRHSRNIRNLFRAITIIRASLRFLEGENRSKIGTQMLKSHTEPLDWLLSLLQVVFQTAWRTVSIKSILWPPPSGPPWRQPPFTQNLMEPHTGESRTGRRLGSTEALLVGW